MGFSHKYDLIKENDDLKDDVNVDIKELSDEPPRRIVSVTTSWWKLLLCNLLAASVGAGVMFLISRGTVVTQPSTSTAGNVADTVPTSTAMMTVTTTLSAHLTLPTSPSEDKIISASAPPIILDCGGTPEEARAKGCVYDVMMQDWVPEPCYDAVLTEKYLAQGNWTWYADGDGKRILTDEEMRKGEHGAAWMSTSYHKAHCVFSWMKIIRALRHSKGISEELLSYDHVLHCSHGALKENIDPDHEDIGVKAPTNYARCAVYEDWKKDFVPDKHDSSERR